MPWVSVAEVNPCLGQLGVCWSRQESCTDSLVVKDRISDAGGPRFDSHAERVTGKPTPKPLEG